jgi:transcription initiation factor TFIID subunit TAF12
VNPQIIPSNDQQGSSNVGIEKQQPTMPTQQQQQQQQQGLRRRMADDDLMMGSMLPPSFRYADSSSMGSIKLCARTTLNPCTTTKCLDAVKFYNSYLAFSNFSIFGARVRSIREC